MSDAREPIRITRQEQSQPDQGAFCGRVDEPKLGYTWPRKVAGLDQPVSREHIQCCIDNPVKGELADEAYFSSSPTESETTEYISRSDKFSSEPEIVAPPRRPQQGAINDISLQLPQICVTDADGTIEIVAPDDNEHGQLWDFARDKIARRMFFVRADQRTRHMESTFYSDLYPVSKTLVPSKLHEAEI